MYFSGPEVGDLCPFFQNTVSIKKLGRVCSCDVKPGTRIDCTLIFYTTEIFKVMMTNNEENTTQNL